MTRKANDPGESNLSGAIVPDAAAGSGGTDRSGVSLLIGLAAGLLAGVVAALAFQVADVLVELPPHLATVNSMSSGKLQEEQRIAQAGIDRMETIANGALFGLCCASIIGAGVLKAGPHEKRPRVAAIVVAAVVSIILGIAGALIGTALSDHWGREASENLLKEASVRGIMFVLVGIGVGLTAGQAFKHKVTGAVFGAVGGALAALVCPILVSMAFPDVRAEKFLIVDLIASISVLGLAGTLIGLLVFVGHHQPQKPVSGDAAP